MQIKNHKDWNDYLENKKLHVIRSAKAKDGYEAVIKTTGRGIQSKDFTMIDSLIGRRGEWWVFLSNKDIKNKKMVGEIKMRKLKNYFFNNKEIVKIINESIFPEEKEKFSPEIVEKALGAIKRYNEYGNVIKRSQELVEVGKTISEISKFAERYTVESAGDWFDAQTIQKNMKELKSHATEFNKIVESMNTQQNRLTMAYDSMGHILNRYFEIADIAEEEDPITRNADSTLRDGDRAKINMNTVRKYNPTPKYVHSVQQEVSRGNGTVKIQKIGKNFSVVSGGDIALFEVQVPTKSLIKTIGRINEAAKFDESKMKKLIQKDKFLKVQSKTVSLKTLFNTYVLGDSTMEKEYNSVK